MATPVFTPDEQKFYDTLTSEQQAVYTALPSKERKTYEGMIAQENITSKAQAQALAALNLSPSNTDSAKSTTQQDYLKLTPASAKALLTKALTDAEYTGKLTNADITDFINKFQTEAQAQMAIVVQNAKDSTKVGKTPTDLTNTIANYVTQNFPSFFNAQDFAKDYAWSKIDFKNEKTLGGKALTALGQARGIVTSFNVLGVSDAEVKVAALAIAKGTKSIQDYTAEIQKIAMKEYPNLADRFKTDPTLTTKDIASPVLNMLGKTWEMDPASIGMDNPLVVAYLHPSGADGKTPPLTYSEVLAKAMNDPKRELTSAANEIARSAATGMARAFGVGL